MYHAIKQLEERNVANEIDDLLWSDKMDLVAFSNAKGEVALHRLSWVRVWSLGPPKEGITVEGLAWRPDGKVLAIAYSSGEVYLINIENKSVIHKIEIEGAISCIFWIKEKTERNNQSVLDDDEQMEYAKYMDNSSKYLPDLPPLSSLGPSLTNAQDENIQNNLFQEQMELNLLVIGTKNGFLYLSIFGQFPCTVMNISSNLGYQCSIINTHFSDNLDTMYIAVKDEESNIKIVLINTSMFKTHSKELFAVALKHGHLNNLITYLSNVIVPMKETWETILLEMDAKLSKYASKLPEGTLSAEFLDLLMFGISSDEMQEFLLQDLTEKGLKKFGQVVEMCYTNIQKLLLKHVTKAGQNITYHLAELRGMARLEYRFKAIGLNEEVIAKAIGSNGAFLTKGGEMHQIITHFMINYKAFFRWLYTAIINLMDPQVVPDMPKNTQQDISHITEFVLNFDNIGAKGADGKPQFTMERLGQYLNDSALTIPVNMDDNIWENFLMKNKCILDDPCIIKHYQNYSLIQQFKHLASCIEEIFKMPKCLIPEQFFIKYALNCCKFRDQKFCITKANYNSENTMIAFLDQAAPANGIYFLEINNKEEILAKCCYFYFCLDGSNYYSVLDVKFYSSNMLSLLLKDNNSSNAGVLCQFLVGTIKDKLLRIDINCDIYKQNIPKFNGMEFGVTLQKYIDGMSCSQFAVSGCRRVSIVLSENRKKVRLFEMEAEEDDEEDADVTNSPRESTTSMQEDSSIID